MRMSLIFLIHLQLLNPCITESNRNTDQDQLVAVMLGEGVRISFRLTSYSGGTPRTLLTASACIAPACEGQIDELLNRDGRIRFDARASFVHERRKVSKRVNWLSI